MKDLTRWWVERMANTTSPFTEKMVLFWHGHFATSAQKVRSPYKMWRQNETFRQHGLGNFLTLVKAISRDPAMMIWLEMSVIITLFQWQYGYFWTNRGYEFALMWTLLCVAIWFRGGGRYSVDHYIGKEF